MLLYLSPAPMDYNHVNITDLVYPEELDQVTFNITIIDDGDDDETIEEFYLNVIPVENAVVLTPRITVEIGCSKIDRMLIVRLVSVHALYNHLLVALHCLHLPIRFIELESVHRFKIQLNVFAVIMHLLCPFSS